MKLIRWIGIRRRKLLFVFLVLVFALGCLGQAGACWKEGLSVEGVGYKGEKIKPHPVPAEPSGNNFTEKGAPFMMPPVLLENNQAQEAGPVLEEQNKSPASILEEREKPASPADNTPVLQSGPGSGENPG